jgi:hypothetical protein
MAELIGTLAICFFIEQNNKKEREKICGCCGTTISRHLYWKKILKNYQDMAELIGTLAICFFIEQNNKKEREKKGNIHLLNSRKKSLIFSNNFLVITNK